jgi:aminoacrylate hydrolase
MPRVEVAGGSLGYEIAGDGEALVLISGLNGLGTFWRSQIEALSPRFKTITFDHRGVGDSTGAPPYSVEQWGEDVVALLDHLGIRAAHLVGHSTGGVIAQVVASDHPHRVTSVVLGGTWAAPDDRFRCVFELRRDVLTALGIEAYSHLGSIMIAPPDDSFASIKVDQFDPVVAKARLDALLSYQGFERLRRIRCPALVVAAADDILIPPHMSRVLAEEIAGAELKILPSGGHAFPRSRAADYNRMVLEFLLSSVRQSPAELTNMPSITPSGQGVRL